MNDMTKEDIKDSVEYKWNIYNRSLVFWIYVFIAAMSFCIVFFSGIGSSDLSDNWLQTSLIAWLIILLFSGIMLVPIMAVYQYKANSFLKNYQDFKLCEVWLENPSTSYWHRGAVYYSVDIESEIGKRTVNTKPYFSSSFLSKFDIKEFNNKKAIGLFDEKTEKFYIVKKAD